MRRVAGLLNRDQFVLNQLKRERNQVVYYMSILFFILGTLYFLTQLILYQRKGDTLAEIILGVSVAIHGMISYLLMRSGKQLSSRLFFLIGLSALVYGAGLYWGGLISFAYPAFFAILTLFVLVEGLMGLILATFSSYVFVVIYYFISAEFLEKDMTYVGEQLENYLIVQILLITFVGVLLFLGNQNQNQLIEAISQGRDKYQQVVENSPDGVMIIDRYGKVVEVNSRILEISGYDEERLYTTHISELIEVDNRERFQVYMEELKIQGFASYQYSFTNQRGERISFDLRGRLLQSGNSLHILRDLSEEKAKEKVDKQLQTLMHDIQKMNIVRRLSGNVAHDFNNLLTAIMGYAEVARYDVEDENLINKLLKIEEVAKRGSSMTKRLLSFTKQQIDSPEYIDIDNEIREMANMMQNLLGVNINLELDLQSDNSMIYIDKNNFEQILLNLIVNSREASLEGSTVTIATRCQNFVNPLDLEDEQLMRVGEEIVELIVQDQGIGIQGDRSKIFEAFYTTKDQGTGLGLSIVYNIIEAANGLIDFVSDETGTIMAIYLPSLADNKQPMVEVQVELPKSRILIIEDEESIAHNLQSAFEREGHFVTLAPNGKVGIEEIKTDQFDFIISDIIMPEMDGFEVYKFHSQYQTKAKILFISGYASTEKMTYLQTKEMDILEKPFTYNKLKLKLLNLIGE